MSEAHHAKPFHCETPIAPTPHRALTASTIRLDRGRVGADPVHKFYLDSTRRD
jgi:hypothetical protein